MKIQDEDGRSLEKISVDWKNYIGDIALTEGYKVKVRKDTLIEISGSKVRFPYAIPLKAGWNIIGYPQTAAYNGMTNIVKQLIDRKTLIKVQDEEGKAIIYLGFKQIRKTNHYSLPE